VRRITMRITSASIKMHLIRTKFNPETSTRPSKVRYIEYEFYSHSIYLSESWPRTIKWLFNIVVHHLLTY